MSLIEEKLEKSTILGMIHKNVLFDGADASVLSMYNRKIGMKDF